MNKSSIKVWRPSHVAGLELARGIESVISVPRHSHEEFELHVVQGGAGKCFCRGTTHVATQGHITLIQSGEAHIASPVGDAGCTFRGMYVSPSLFADAAMQMTDKQRGILFFPESHLTNPFLAAKFLDFHCAIEGTTTRLEQEVCLLDLLAGFTGQFASERLSVRHTGPEHYAVGKAREYLEENYREDVSLDALAKVACLSPFHLCRVFSRDVGVPPHIHQTQMRLTRAKPMLLQGLPIGDVAVEVGFYDHAHFTQCFRRYVQVTPRQYVRDSGISDAKTARFS